jgi:hypothetical protein
MNTSRFDYRSLMGRMSLVLLALTAQFGCTNDVALTRDDGGTDAPGLPDGAPEADTPDAPHSDANDAGDAPSDASVCGDTIPCCPEDLNNTGGQNNVTIRYPTTIVRDLDGAFPSQMPYEPQSLAFDGTWAGVTTLASPVTQDCVARFVTSPPSAPCAADAVAQIDRPGLTPVRMLLGIPATELVAFAAGTPVHARVEVGIGDQTYPDDHLIVGVETTDGTALVVAASISMMSESTRMPAVPVPSWTFGQFTVTRSAAPFCIASPMLPCMRTFEADDLVVTVDGASHTVHPMETLLLTTARGRYRITHHAIVRRNEALRPGGASCADARPDHWSFEIVRLAD